MRAALAVFFTLFLFGTIVAQLNHVLTGWGVYLWIGGLFITHPALGVSARAGFAAALLGGLLLDAATPVTFGTHALLFAVGHALVFRLRDRIPRDETAPRVALALIANLVLFLVFTFLQSRHLPADAPHWPRVLVDLLCSQLFILVAAPWFFALQARTLELTHSAVASYERRFG